MEAKEFATIAMAIKAAYPNSNIMPDDKSRDVWYTMLADLDYGVCMVALKEHISTNKFPPAISELRERCARLTSLKVADWGEAWGQVNRAIRHFGSYRPEEALDSLDPVTRKCVQRIGFVNLCLSENIVADRANFRLIYEQESKRIQEDNQLPMKVREEKLKLEQIINQTLKGIEIKE